MKKIVIVTVTMLAFSFMMARAQRMDQDYRTALGVKVWANGGGVSLKHFVSPNHALEGIGYFWDRGVRLTGLYEFHFDIADAPGLKWYVGPGAHIGFYNNHYDDRFGNYGNGGSFVGVDGVLGLDYKFDRAPINLSLDWQPSVEFGDGRGFNSGWGGVGIRYTFK